MKKYATSRNAFFINLLIIILLFSCQKNDVVPINYVLTQSTDVEFIKKEIENNSLDFAESLSKFENEEALHAFNSLVKLFDENSYGQQDYDLSFLENCIASMSDLAHLSIDSVSVVIQDLLVSGMMLYENEMNGVYQWINSSEKWVKKKSDTLVVEFPYFYHDMKKLGMLEILPINNKGKSSNGQCAFTAFLYSDLVRIAQFDLRSKPSVSNSDCVVECEFTTDVFQNSLSLLSSDDDIVMNAQLKEKGFEIQRIMYRKSENIAKICINDLVFDISSFESSSGLGRALSSNNLTKQGYVDVLNDNITVAISNKFGEKYASGSFYLLEKYIDSWEYNITDDSCVFSKRIDQLYADLYALRFQFDDGSKIDLNAYLPVEYGLYLENCIAGYLFFLENERNAHSVIDAVNIFADYSF